MRSRLLIEGSELPLLVEPASEKERGIGALLAWVTEERDWIEQRLLRHGGLLFRGFAVETSTDFERYCKAIDAKLLNYVGGESPRSPVTEKVYTSTEYPSHLEIALHNEMSYANGWPSKLFFFCWRPAAQGGETPIADSRKVLAAIDPEVRKRFMDRQVMYVNNFHDGWGLGKSWQQIFETSDRSQVELYCRQNDTEFRWIDTGLWTRAIRPAVIIHPATGESVWFNQADRWHVSSRGREKSRAMLKVMTEEELPRNAYYGDGSRIDTEDLETIREIYRDIEIALPWEKGDILLLDNILAAHGRRPYQGPRKIMVAMA